MFINRNKFLKIIFTFATIMALFQAELILPSEFTIEFVGKIPAQRALVDRLLSKRIILSYSLAADRSKVWVIFECNKEEQVIEHLASFPIITDVQFEIHELAFYNAASLMMPQFSLN